MTTPTKKIAPFGAWTSPLSSQAMLADQVGLGAPHPLRKSLLWTESRPTEGGRVALLARSSEGLVQDLLAPDGSVRTRVHEYGGGALAASEHRIVYSSDRDRRLYTMDLNGEGRVPLTPEGRFSWTDISLSPDDRFLFCVREDHTREGEPANEIVRIALDGSEIVPIVTGRDFVAAPRISPDGRNLAWIAWDHPNMPWDDSELWQVTLDADGHPGEPEQIMGGSNQSVFQPEWSPDGILHFVSDASGWWNLYRMEPSGPRNLCAMDAEFGLPQWVFGMRTYAFVGTEEIICTFGRDGFWNLARLQIASGELQVLTTEFSGFDGLRVCEGRASFIGSRSSGPSALAQLDLGDGSIEILRESGARILDPEFVSIPEPVEIPTGDGEVAFAFYYPPRNPDFEAPPGELPPLRVKSHGGPTGAARPDFDPRIQFWTTRGFAVVDVNYRGSTGYGRAYRDALKGNWGIHDVDDCESAAKFLAARGSVDPSRLTISGGSAGGYTTLAALTFTETFACGASHYGIGDLAALARDTHKFESRYTDSLVAPWPAGEAVYRERSPIAHTNRLGCPVIFFQGLEDKVVPPNQAEEMVAALKAKGIRVEYMPLAGEGHGFRRAESISAVLGAELKFFREVLGIRNPD
ncbi:MAG: S9 family peptidase [Candidatus Binatia bacterium]|nr:S9 family peptidase [Candidatus Binatia bacterium]MDG2009391.1 S9 family peptidase [Candidatus Binatia bacterium]